MTVERLEKANVLHAKISKLTVDIDKLLIAQEQSIPVTIVLEPTNDKTEIDQESLGYIIQGLITEKNDLMTKFSIL